MSSINRIVARTPSTGKPIFSSITDVPSNFVPLVSAPDFSVPDPSGRFDNRDPENPNSRAIRPGEVFVLTPLAVRNKTGQTQRLEIQVRREDNSVLQFGEVLVPANDTALVPIQGRSLLKLDPESTTGDTIEIKADFGSVFDVWLSSEERLANEHSGLVLPE